jgi:monofunctional glycosyltransferase
MGIVSTSLQKYPRVYPVYRFMRGLLIKLFFAHLIYTFLLILMPVWTTPTIIGQWLSGTPIRKQWVPLEKISISMQHAVVAAEDQAFEEHFGLDFEAIEKAIDYNKSHKKKKGASTISQQVAKNVFLWQSRTWLRKGLEVYCTFLIELLWSKERILEVYLNVAEMGNGVFGCEAAAQYYFKKPASKLTEEEAALIAACLPNPIKYRANSPSDYVRRRQRWIISQMHAIEWN